MENIRKLNPMQMCKAIWCRLSMGMVMISIISLERWANKKRSASTTLIQVLATMDEGVQNRILSTRQIPFSRQTDKYLKIFRQADLLCRDLQIDPRILRPRPIYIDWQNNFRFSLMIPAPL
jgi:hypothetical protein